MTNEKIADNLCEECFEKNTKGFRKAFKGRTLENIDKMRKVLEIINSAKKLGWETDFEEFVKGCDWFFITCKEQFVYAHNSSDNSFIVCLPESDSFELDRGNFMEDVEWYKKIVQLIYG